MARENTVNSQKTMTQGQAAQKKRMKVSAFIILLGIPVVGALGIFFLPKTWYMPLSMVILTMTMAPFFMVFEQRKPKAREIVLLAMMCALTVATHTFFHIILPIQIGTAMVIISGISLGPEAGFLIGALSRFICNFYMGQGPWTPWQMFCWGLLGFLAGLAFNKGSMDVDKINSRHFRMVLGPVFTMLFAFAAAYISFLIYPGTDESFIGWRLYVFGFIGLLAGVLVQRKRLPVDGLTLSLFTFFTVFVIYGGIMNAAKLLMSLNMKTGTGFSFSALRALYITGAPYDFMHATTAAICVFLLGDNMIKKIERIKIKYGIYK